MEGWHATLALVVLIAVTGCLSIGPGGTETDGSSVGPAVTTESNKTASNDSSPTTLFETTDTEAETRGTVAEIPATPSTYYLYVNQDTVDRRVSLFVVDGDEASLRFELANGSSATARRPTPELLHTGVTAVRPAGEVLWNETVTVGPNSTVLLAFRNATRQATVVKHSVTNATEPGAPLSSVDVASSSVSQTVAVDGPGAQRSVSGRPLEHTEYAGVSVDAVRTIDLNRSA